MSSLSVHEKFLPYTISFNKKVDELCDSACDSEKNYTRYCPSECISVCPKYCQNIMPMPERTSIHVNIGHHHEASHLLIAMLSLAGATLLVIFLYFAYVRVQNSRRLPRVFQRSEESEDVFFDGEDQRDDVVEVDHPIWYIRTIGLQPCVIDSIMVFKYKRSDGLIDGTECSVCLAEFEEDETLRLLPKCSHAFHVPCIDTWLSSHTNCPMCRAPIVVNSASRGVLAVEQDSGNEIPTGEEESDGSNRNVESREEEMGIGIVGGEELETYDERERNEVDEIQPVRRSVSLDSLDASKIGQSFSNVRLVRSGKIPCSRIEEFNCKSSGVDLKRVGSSSSGRSLQNGHSFMRLLSLSSQKLQSKYSRSQSSVLPL